MTQRYRDKLMSGGFTEKESQTIIGIAHAICRWVNIEERDFKANGDYEWGIHVILRDDFNKDFWLESDDMSRALNRNIQYWFLHYAGGNHIRHEDLPMVKYAVWEAYWLMRNTTAYDAAQLIAS